MEGTVLGNVGGLTEAQRSVRDQFVEGGSILASILVVLCVAAVALLLPRLIRMLICRFETGSEDDPQRLYRSVLDELNLKTSHRKALVRLAKDLGLAHPSAILLSERLYDDQLAQWKATGKAVASEAEALIDARSAIFPAG